jgi:hypothetical protein
MNHRACSEAVHMHKGDRICMCNIGLIVHTVVSCVQSVCVHNNIYVL